MATTASPALKGADRVRKRPGVIFGSDGLEGCEHAVFEILSNAIDEARAGLWQAHHRDPLCWTTPSRWRTQGRGCPGGLEREGGALQLGAGVLRAVRRRQIRQRRRRTTTSTPWASTVWAPAPPSTPADYMDVTVCRDGNEYTLHFERGEIVGRDAGDGAQAAAIPAPPSAGCRIWRCSPTSTFRRTTTGRCCKRQAVVNAGRHVPPAARRSAGQSFETEDFLYENGIRDYLTELGRGRSPDGAAVLGGGAPGPGPGGQAGVQGEAERWRWCFSNRVQPDRALPQLQLSGVRRQSR